LWLILRFAGRSKKIPHLYFICSHLELVPKRTSCWVQAAYDHNTNTERKNKSGTDIYFSAPSMHTHLEYSWSKCRKISASMSSVEKVMEQGTWSFFLTCNSTSR
jgi:hypothetical protein